MRFPSALAAIALGCAVRAPAAGPTDLESGFADPPRAARPTSWHFWMAGNISEPGLKDSFEKMDATGIGSVEVMQLNTYGGRTPEGPVKVLSDEWRGLLDRFFQLADEKKMGATLFTTETGWSMMGDAKIEPKDSSKRLTSSETVVEGGRPGPVQLAPPASTLDVYEELAVVAFPDPIGTTHPRPAVEGAPRGQPRERLTDGQWRTGVRLPTRDVSLVLAYPRPLWVKSLRFWMNQWASRPDEIVVEVEDGKGGWKELGRMDTYWPHGYRDVPLVARLKPARGQRFRVTFRGGANAVVNGVELTGAPLVDLFDAKAGYTQRREHGGGADIIRASAQKWAIDENLPGLDPAKFIDLTGKLAADGALDWAPPPGRWRIVRVGYTTCGHKAGPSPQHVRCYIVDPVGAGAVEDYWSRFPAATLAKHGPAAGGAIDSVELDSWEAGNLNWSTDFAREFQKRRGYGIGAWWPLLASGYVVRDTLSSERFLRDFRLTLAELISERYYAETARAARRGGVELFAEACGRQQFAYHPTEYLRHADVPMGEFWVNEGKPRVDCRAAASMANFYGRPRVAGESFTATGDDGDFDWMPADFKRLGDEAFIEGINHFMLILNTLTPYRGPGPGVVCANIGSQMLTGNTWWGRPARGWTDYLARCQFLLQQGRNVSDILYFAGEDFPAELPSRENMRPAIPPSLDYDACGPTELLEHVTVKEDGALASPGGARYRMLLLRDWPTMSVEVAGRIRSLARDGAIIIGPPPQRAAGLSHPKRSENTIREVRDELWSAADAKATVDRRTGKGRIIWNKGFVEIFASLGLPHDFVGPAGGNLRHRHRTGDGFDLYFVSNQEDEPFCGELGFRVTGKTPELWDPVSGTTRKLAHWTEADGMARLSVDLAPYGSAFVVFREGAATPATASAPAAPAASVRPVQGPWQITFQKDRGAPDAIELPALIDLATHADAGVAHFSGTATYSAEFDVPDPYRVAVLDLGAVHGIAEVTINGRPVANLWCLPYRVELPGDALRKGINRMEIAVTGSWRNRMIGDEQYPRDFRTVKKPPYEYVNEWPDWYVSGAPRPEKERVSFCTTLFYKASDPLKPSGLAGPVTLQTMEKIGPKP